MSKFDYENKKDEHKKQFEFLDMFLSSMAECSDNAKYKALKIEHRINNKMPELLLIRDGELQEELNYLINILEQAEKCINDIFEKGNIGKDE